MHLPRTPWIPSALVAALLAAAGSATAQAPGEGLVELGAHDDVGAALQPGTLPAEATPEARAAWRELCAATLVDGETRVPVTAFDLRFDGRANTQGSHDFDGARFLYLAPAYVSSELSEANRLIRGPEGDWLVGKRDVVRLVGRETIQDRRQLDDTVNIASNFAALTDPGRMRIAELTVGDPPPGLPSDPEMVTLAAGLVWVQVTSPDLQLYRHTEEARRGAALYRARLGLDPETHLPELVVINELRDGRDSLGSALLVRFDKYKPLDGYRVPHVVQTHSLDPQVRTPTFRARPDLQLWLFPGGSLRPALESKDFLPPKPAKKG